MPVGNPVCYGEQPTMTDERRAYVCVYRHAQPSARDLERTRNGAANKSLIDRYLAAYSKEDSFLDWGDDPSFFCSQKLLGSTRKASWGVCRRDVRSSLSKGDFVVFICAKQRQQLSGWRYYYIGFGTIGDRVKNPATISRSSRYSQYSEFLNVLAQVSCGTLRHSEQVYPYHEDWKRRIQGPYLIFEDHPSMTDFNLKNPLWIASCRANDDHETWRSEEIGLVRELETALFTDRGIERRLRTARKGYPHPKLNLYNRPGESLSVLRKTLKRIAVDARKLRQERF
jgi:hypothetical protein